jgi:hypothetical protein
MIAFLSGSEFEGLRLLDELYGLQFIQKPPVLGFLSTTGLRAKTKTIAFRAMVRKKVAGAGLEPATFGL